MQTARSSYESTSIRTQVGNKERGNNPDINLGSMSPEEIRHLLHELQVHQLELQIQNKSILNCMTLPLSDIFLLTMKT